MNTPRAYRTYLNGLVSDRKYVKIQYFTELHELITLNALLVGLGQDGTDPMVTLSSGEQVPLAKLVSAEEEFAPMYAGYAPYCETCDC